MDLYAVIDHVQTLLHAHKRLSYRALKLQFQLDDEHLEAVKEELIEIRELASDKDGKMLIWKGATETPKERPAQLVDAPAAEPPASAPSPQPEQEAPAGERRQLTVMFCDLVGSTALSEQLDPEELQALVRTYQEVSAQVIERYAGYIAQYLGDGLLIYFGYPAAHEDDAARAIRAGLGIITALHEAQSQFPQPVQVRVGIHTGPVVVGQMGGGSRHEQLALGETPNIAARLQSVAQPDDVVISAATHHLVTGLFEMQDQGRIDVKGLSLPLSLFRVTAEGTARSRFDVAVRRGLTPLVGRELEAGFLAERWEQAQTGAGQAVLLSGEPGIGKSRLTSELRTQVEHHDDAVPLAFQCSPYTQNSAFSPIIDRLSQVLQVRPEDTPEQKVEKLHDSLCQYRFPQEDTLALFTNLLSLPVSADSPPLTLSPQRQKQKTQEALIAWFLEAAEQRAVYAVWEDLHWADSSTLEVLGLLLDQLPTARILAVLTYRPEFSPPWPVRSHMTQFTLGRLGQAQMEAMVTTVTGGKLLPPALMAEVVSKTDGIPLFVEEFTKMVVESDWLQETDGHYALAGPLPALSIPSTLQDSLMARLDRQVTAKAVAQLGATVGREFSYALIAAISPLDEATLSEGLRQLVEAELVYQRGLPPDAQYQFKHALVQDTAYQSLLKRTRQRYHQQIAQVLEERFTQTIETPPELLAHHYTEAGLAEQAIPYWQKAGQRAVESSAYAEAISHLTKGLGLLQTLPDSPERVQQELSLQLSLGAPLVASKGYGSEEVAQTYTRARELCQQIGETPQLFSALRGLWVSSLIRADYRTAYQLGEQLLHLAQSGQDPELLVEAHYALGQTLWVLGKFFLAQEHLGQVLTLYSPDQRHAQVARYGLDLGVSCQRWMALNLWFLGYPTQALQRSHGALTLVRELNRPFDLAYTQLFAAILHQLRLEGQATREWAEKAITLSTDQGFAYVLAMTTSVEGWALAEQGQVEKGIVQLRQGLAACQSSGGDTMRSHYLAQLATAYEKRGQTEEGLSILTEALDFVDKTGEGVFEAELYRLKGELLRQSDDQSLELRATDAEACFRQAIDIARQQEAKSWELRAATSLARLWQSQGKKHEAHDLLTPVYNWFTEGFDTADLKDAKSLLDELT